MSFIEQIEQWDTALFLFLNGAHSPFFDEVMWGISYKFTWIPLYVLLLFLLYRKYGWRSLLLCLPVIALLIGATDQCTNLLKSVLVERYRPCHNIDLEGLVHVVGKCGGKYGFTSGHSGNSFAIATFMFFLLRPKKIFYWLFFWAALVAYSRIYNGVHYPLDVLGGALLGITFGYLCSKLFGTLNRKFKLQKAVPNNP
jgi:undecaprenyl-diphosphatase